MNNLIKRSTLTIILFLLLPSLIMSSPWYIYSLFMLSVLLIILLKEWPKLFDYKGLLFWLIMPAYPILPILLVIKLQYLQYTTANLFLVLSVGFHDTGSYIAGKLFGKNKILPLVSPGKTWEGFLGGVIICFLMSIYFFYYFNINLSTFYVFILSLTVCMVSLCGDLFESLLKRRAGIKDTGDFLLGHGGLLDRCDSMLFVAFLIYLIKDYFKCF